MQGYKSNNAGHAYYISLLLIHVVNSSVVLFVCFNEEKMFLCQFGICQPQIHSVCSGFCIKKTTITSSQSFSIYYFFLILHALVRCPVIQISSSFSLSLVIIIFLIS